MSFSESLVMMVANAAPAGAQRLVRAAASSALATSWADAVMEGKLRRAKRLRRIAIVSDTNIGDALVLQGACSVFKRYLPECQIDYFYQAKAEPLLRRHPDIDHHRPLFTDSDFTSQKNRHAVQAAVADANYDLILNLYPFLLNGDLKGAGCPILVPHRLVSEVVKAELNPNATAHVLYHTQRYMARIASRCAQRSEPTAPGVGDGRNTIYVDREATHRANQLLGHLGVGPGERLAFLNPDSSSRFSMIPVDLQVELVQGLLLLNEFDRIVVGPGYVFADVAEDVCRRIAMPKPNRRLVKLPRGIPIDAYAALIDRADLFVTADTAQLHMAAARRCCIDDPSAFRNRTAIVSVFGATNSRIYGYDSYSRGYLGSSQDAPAKVFEGEPACKNLTCIHKTRKTCRTVKCFAGVTSRQILGFIEHWIQGRDTIAAGKSELVGGYLKASS